MTLAQGTRLGPYEILSAIGAGGMGEVYKARDTRLDRPVAIKVLPSDVSSSQEQRQRFEREARAISKLSHPHICALFDVGREGENEYLVMELLEGETLSDRLSRGPLPLEQTLRYGAQIADALDKAHRQGIVHRDLKPGNVMLTKSGVKLLDFGLAKAIAPEASPSDLTSNPTAAARSDLTQEGTLLGTLPYMAPEQLEGKEADERTDIFALGATLYEMASGRKAFSGASRASLISSILRDEPGAVSQIEVTAPRALDRLIGRCLAKDPDRRWQSAADVGLELESIGEGGQVQGESPALRRKRIEWIWPIGLALLVGALAWFAGRRLAPAPGATRASRLSVLPPEGASLLLQEAPALSPDGSRLAFVAVDASGRNLLYVRPLDSLTATALPDTEGARMPFWAPDGRSLGFFAEGKLKTIQAAGGHSQTLCDAPTARGGTWNAEGAILFVPSPPQPPQVISASGGEAKPVPMGELAVGPFRRSPYFLPDGRHYLYLAYNRAPEKNAIWVGSLDSKDSRRLVSSQSSAAYAAPGYLVFRRDKELVAQRFDPDKLELRGDPVALVSDVGFNPITLLTLFAVSNDGTLAYLPANSMKSQLAWIGRDGKQIGLIGSPGYRNSLSLSADGRRAAYDEASANGDLDVWTFDMDRGVPSRITFDPGTDFFPVLSPDGSRVVFSSMRGAPPTLYEKMTSGAAAEQPIFQQGRPQLPATWSADGRFLVYGVLDPKTKWDVWVLPMSGDRRPFPFAQTGSDERAAEVSPDGNWMAYASNESGNSEIYVRPFGGGPGKWQVSRDGGFQPHWRHDGRELFFLANDSRIMAVQVRSRPPAFEAGAPTPLFRAAMAGGLESQSTWNTYAPSPDGQRFLISTFGERANGAPIALILGWDAEVRKDTPRRQ